MLSAETIVAPATPPGEGGVGILRLSGASSPETLDRVFRGRCRAAAMQSHKLYHGRLVDGDVTLDDILAVVMRAPHSYTGEDVVELHCHGGMQIMRSALDLLLKQGARMAAPGEFTQRAFLNGRLDLAQAEAVAELIAARSARAGRVAMDQLDGRLSRLIHDFSARLKDALALLEAHIDFPDDEVGSLDLPALLAPLDLARVEMQHLADSFDFGRALREGVSVLILGRPNVGKSSLMNALLGEARAIVTEVAGTTRDTLEEQLVLAGFPVRLIDAAGVHDTDDPVEREGVQRARDKVGSSDLVLLVVDGSVALSDADRHAAALCDPHSTLLVVNKSDQAQCAELDLFEAFARRVVISAKHRLGLDELRATMTDCLSQDMVSGEGVVINERRHRDALQRAIEALERLSAAAGREDPLECLALEVREVLAALGQITGETTPDEILDQIFSRFCIGK